jgi:hypothetical protein
MRLVSRRGDVLIDTARRTLHTLMHPYILNEAATIGVTSERFAVAAVFKARAAASALLQKRLLLSRLMAARDHSLTKRGRWTLGAFAVLDTMDATLWSTQRFFRDN